MVIYNEENQNDPIIKQHTPPEISKLNTENLSSSSFDIKSYIESHPGAHKGIFRGYQSDVDALLDDLLPQNEITSMLGLSKEKIFSSIRDKTPWLWDAVYGEPDSDLEPPSKPKSHSKNGNGYRPDLEDDDYDSPDSVNEEDWREAIEYAIELRRLRIPPSSIADKILEHYDIDIDPRQITKLISNYLLDQKADRYVSETSYKPQIRTRTNDSILLKVSSLMADKKGLIAEINGLQSKLDLIQNPTTQKVGLIRKAFRLLW